MAALVGICWSDVPGEEIPNLFFPNVPLNASQCSFDLDRNIFLVPAKSYSWRLDLSNFSQSAVAKFGQVLIFGFERDVCVSCQTSGKECECPAGVSVIRTKLETQAKPVHPPVCISHDWDLPIPSWKAELIEEQETGKNCELLCFMLPPQFGCEVEQVNNDMNTQTGMRSLFPRRWVRVRWENREVSPLERRETFFF